MLAALCTAECGKPLAESMGEVGYATSFIKWFAEEGKRAYCEVIPTFASGSALTFWRCSTLVTCTDVVVRKPSVELSRFLLS